MFEDEFTQMLKDYPNAAEDKRKFIGLMKDCFPGQQMQINLINTTYELGIASEIAKAALINNAFAFRFVKRLVDEYGVSRLNADWAVSVWCVCYGERVLRKPCEIQISHAKSGAAPAIQEERSPDAGKQYGELFRYTKIPGGYGVTGFIGQNKRTLIFSNRHNNQSVTKIMARAFSESEVQEAVMTDGITVIDEGAFKGCIELRQVIFPLTLKEIGDHAFAGCGNLITASLPSSLEQIGKYAFTGTPLKNIIIPQTVYWIGEGAFSHCNKISSIEIPDNIISIPNRLFQGCDLLAKVTLPETVDAIGDYAFSGCHALQSISIPESVHIIGDNAFDDVHPKFTILCQRQSDAEQYARKHDITFQIVY